MLPKAKKISIYSLKSRFQTLLGPVKNYLTHKHIKPNQITLFACAICICYASLLAWSPYTRALLFLLPVFMFIRMALNALDGMVAESTNNKTPLGSVLNEVCDVIADAALFSAFLVLLSSLKEWWWLLTVLCLLTEFVSLSMFQAHGIRSHSGPFGKSDRAVYLGILAFLLAIFPTAMVSTPIWLDCYLVVGIGLSLLTIRNRFQT